MTRPTVILGMSGGVDSSVAASLLVEQGYDVHGVTLQVWEHEDEEAVSRRWQDRGCCKIGLARHVAKHLGFSYEVCDVRDIFRTAVVDDFVTGYLSGTTPNPCVRCNERVKLRLLMALAEERGADFVATGHYAQIRPAPDGQPGLYRSPNQRKDQSYFLYRLNPLWLPKLLFPVGTMDKAEVWARSEALGLPADELKESQEICFVTQGDYRTFLASQAPEACQPGDFTDPQGRRLGRHEGIAFYTPGQRRGLGLATGHRLYVQRVLPASHTVVLAPEAALYADACALAELNVLDPTLCTQSRTAEVKFRYATPAVPAHLLPRADGTLQVRFTQAQRALTPGQSAVCYDADRVLGGGIIQAPLPLLDS